MAAPATLDNSAELKLLLEKEREVSRLLAASVERLEQKLAQMDLLRRLYGRSSETSDPNQLLRNK